MVQYDQFLHDFRDGDRRCVRHGGGHALCLRGFHVTHRHPQADRRADHDKPGGAPLPRRPPGKPRIWCMSERSETWCA
ncbi:hypothetical protein ACU4GD_21385 [Cupriavidus basilensis]